jgi:hypothetical protein
VDLAQLSTIIENPLRIREGLDAKERRYLRKARLDEDITMPPGCASTSLFSNGRSTRGSPLWPVDPVQAAKLRGALPARLIPVGALHDDSGRGRDVVLEERLEVDLAGVGRGVDVRVPVVRRGRDGELFHDVTTIAQPSREFVDVSTSV